MSDVNVSYLAIGPEVLLTLGAVVVLMVDVTKATRTVAAMVLGCRMLDRAFDLAVDNRCHQEQQRQAVQPGYC